MSVQSLFCILNFVMTKKKLGIYFVNDESLSTLGLFWVVKGPSM